MLVSYHSNFGDKAFSHWLTARQIHAACAAASGLGRRTRGGARGRWWHRPWGHWIIGSTDFWVILWQGPFWNMGGSWNRGTPSYHPFIDGFSLTKHQVLGTPFQESFIWLCPTHPVDFPWFSPSRSNDPWFGKCLALVGNWTVDSPTKWLFWVSRLTMWQRRHAGWRWTWDMGKQRKKEEEQRM